MAQYDVYPNPSQRSSQDLPYLVDVQSDLLSGLATRLVMPLSRTDARLANPPRRLSPRFMVVGEWVSLLPHEAVGMDARLLRKPVASLAVQSGEIRDALDAVISGI
jgi:toxin CcdB